jgi:hypothetical protein
MTKLVVPRGNAPRSSGYQPDALLLSYETMMITKLAEGVGPRFAKQTSKAWETNGGNWEFKCSDLGGVPILFSRQVQPAYICLPSKMVKVAGVAPATSSFRTRPSAADITP